MWILEPVLDHLGLNPAPSSAVYLLTCLEQVTQPLLPLFPHLCNGGCPYLTAPHYIVRIIKWVNLVKHMEQ